MTVATRDDILWALEVAAECGRLGIPTQAICRGLATMLGATTRAEVLLARAEMLLAYAAVRAQLIAAGRRPPPHHVH